MSASSDSRSDLRQDRREDFGYDSLNRLTGATLIDTLLDPQGLTPLSLTDYAYDALGNLTYKSDVGTYTYGGPGAGPHAVTAVTGAVNKTYAYDANGSTTRTFDAAANPMRLVGWSSFNKPVRMDDENSPAISDFVYGPNRARIKQVAVYASGDSKTITYIGGAFERHETAAPGAELVHYIRAGATVAIYTKIDDGTGTPPSDKTRYLHQDHLGSITLITDEAGLKAERRSFDSHGKLRGDDWTVGGATSGLGETRRGFTGHEHIDTVGLIHMNGRVYDPEIGRFLSADPFVQVPENLQSFNRYTYVNNNPLSYTDPSGFFFKKLFKFIKQILPAIITIVVSAVACGPAVLACGTLAFALVGAITSAAVAGITTLAYGGDLADAVTAAAFAAGTSLAFSGVGAAFGPAGGNFLSPAHLAKTVAHGVVGGVSSEVRGGKFTSGFLAAGVTQFAAPGISEIAANDNSTGAKLQRTMVAAVVGGTAAELGGGKFANGAATGAFSRFYNDEGGHAKRRPSSDLTNEELKKLSPILTSFNRKIQRMDIDELRGFFNIPDSVSDSFVEIYQENLKWNLLPTAVDGIQVIVAEAYLESADSLLTIPLGQFPRVGLLYDTYSAFDTNSTVSGWFQNDLDYSAHCFYNGNCVAVTPRGTFTLP